MTQRARVLAQLKRTGRVNRTDFLLPHVVDHGEPILGIAQRIQELRERGFPIVTKKAKNKTAVWTLDVHSAPVAPPTAPAEAARLKPASVVKPAGPQTNLFDLLQDAA